MSSRLLDIARKFNVFYLNGNFTMKVFVLISTFFLPFTIEIFIAFIFFQSLSNMYTKNNE